MSEKKGVYLVFDGATELTKIGSTVDFERRLKEYRALNPSIIALFVFPFKAGEDTEKKLHEIYGKYRDGGEWFRLKKGNVIDIAAYMTDLDTERANQFIEDLNHIYEE
jgi:hypothetical protein